MDLALHRRYLDVYSPALYARYRARLEAEVGPVPFRLAETPLFLTRDLRDELFRSTEEILAQLAEPARLERMRKAIPAHLDVPGMDAQPDCMTVDFAIVRGPDGGFAGRVVELQAFPSIYAFTMVQGQVWAEMLAGVGLEGPWSCLNAVTDFADGVDLLRRTILAGLPAEEVVLLDIDPPTQKTRPDFEATRRLVGIQPVCLTDVKKDGRRLFYPKDGRLLPIRRIFNRVVFDELLRRKPAASFAFTDELDVTFCPHPNWYWVWSKASLPLLDHPAVPRAILLADLDEPPADLAAYVLKPLFSFAGAGVNVEPTAADLAAVPEAQRPFWLLQQKISYAREMTTPDGHGIAAEVRILCLRPPGEPVPRPLTNLVRLSRGKMLGIDFNRDLDWTGSTVALSPADGGPARQ